MKTTTQKRAPKSAQKPTAEKPTAPKSAPKSEKAPKAPAAQKPAAEKATAPTTTTAPQEAAAVIPAPEAKPARRYTAAEARAPQAYEALSRALISAAVSGARTPTRAQLEAYEAEIISSAAAKHGKAPRWTQSHGIAKIAYQLGISADEIAAAKTKGQAKKTIRAAAKARLAPAEAWSAVMEISADEIAAKAIYESMSDAQEELRTRADLLGDLITITRAGGEAAGVIPTKGEEARARRAAKRAAERRAAQRQAAEAIYYRHLAAHLEEGEAAEEAKKTALGEAAAYLRDDLKLDAEEALVVWEEAAKAYRG